MRGVRSRVAALREWERRRALWAIVDKALTPPAPSAYAAFGSGALVIPPARVESPESISIGTNARLHENVWLCVKPQEGLPQPRLVIGARTSINRFVKIVCIGDVFIGENCLVGDFVFIADTRYRFDDPDLPISGQGLMKPEPVRIGNGAHIGVRAIVMPGVTVGDNAYVGAGAVVEDDVPDRCVAVGNPARIIRRYDPESRSWVKA
jgi:acetyltransferase-like isoleucine patch superfamily enzyme